MIEINHLYFGDGRLPDKSDQILEKLEKIIMENAELYALIQALPAQMEKVKTEITGKIEDLELAISGGVPSEVVAALDTVKASLDALDAIVPDAVEPAPVEDPVVEPPVDPLVA